MSYNVFNNSLAPDPVTVGIAFGGGGVRSFAEIAALRDLLDKGLPMTAVAGTSMGAALAALTAAGLEPERIERLLLDSEAKLIEMGLFKPNWRMVIPKSNWTAGLVDVAAVTEFFTKVFADLGIEKLSDLKLPAAFTSVDLKQMKPLIFSNVPAWFKGIEDVEFYPHDISLATAVAASCAFPLAISTLVLDDYLLLDGGVHLNIPTTLFNRELIDVVVALSIKGTHQPMVRAYSPLNIALRSAECMAVQLDHFHRRMADISIEIPAAAEVFDWGKGPALIENAYAYLRNTPQDYGPYFAMVKEREQDWALEQAEIQERLVKEQALKEKEAAKSRGWRGLVQRMTGKKR